MAYLIMNLTVFESILEGSWLGSRSVFSSRYGPLMWPLTCFFFVWVGLGVQAVQLYVVSNRYVQDSRLGVHTKGPWL